MSDDLEVLPGSGTFGGRLRPPPRSLVAAATVWAVRHRRIVLAGVVAAQCADLATFVAGLGRAGIRAEDNPIAQLLYEQVGLAGPVLFKLAAISALCVVFRLVFTRLPWIALPAAAIAIGLGLLGTAGNVGNGTLL